MADALPSPAPPLPSPGASAPEDWRDVLYTVDAQGRRRWLHVHLNGGRWRAARIAVAAGLVAFYLAAPFLSVGGRPFLRFDIPNRLYWVAGHAFWPQDFFYILLAFLIFLVGTLLAVSLAGRVYCGWLCPHSIFLEMVYRPLERLLQGPARSRAKGVGPLRAAAAWVAYAAVSGALANTFTALFTGPEAFARLVVMPDPQAHPAATAFWAASLAVILGNFAWFREQMCTIVCPYGRFQTALLDAETPVPAYDARRGEPRGKATDPQAGHCIDCRMCVAVCPTGIDIRNGNQLECIHCTACIDACDAVMAKLRRPAGLVRFASEQALAGRPARRLRPRTLVYAAALAGLTALLAVMLAQREDLLVTKLGQTVLPVVERDPEGRESVRLVLPLSLVNRSHEPHTVAVAPPPGLDARLVLPQPETVLAPNQRVQLPVIVYVPLAALDSGPRRAALLVTAPGHVIEVPFVVRRP